jgi:hypothetical protein
VPDENELGARLLVALSDFVDVTAAIPPDLAIETFDQTVAEVFFRDWPTIRSWAESVWQRVEGDLTRAALPEEDPRSPETGTGG